MNEKALHNLSYGLYVAFAKGKKDNGCVTNTPIQVTSTPLKISLTLNKQNYTTELIKKSKAFTISCLSEDAPFSVFQNFGFQSGHNVDKFADFPDVARGANGIYYLTKYANSYLSGQVEQVIDLGTHDMFIASVTDAEVLSAVPTMTYSYYQTKVKPQSKPKAEHGYKCGICGYIYEGEPLPADFVCPICKHGAADFEKF
ncbi:MAG: flavin reductase [Clostridiales Family XIII bacterium]|jgi:flavin reductase (DIM6/NTAB) family NADH-FMN oxidoreductase RutF|nr:flavin reductase [Clostridiales Family XIII bacterium]